MRNLIFLTLILLISPFIIYAQSGNPSLEGTVTGDEGDPLHLANISIQELSLSTSTDENGKYLFSEILPGSYHMHISLTGYMNQTVTADVVTGENTLDIILERSLIETPTIDVTGNFQPTDISNSTFSITSLGPRTVTKERSQNIASTIENTPGVNNLSTGNGIGKPVIRGLTSQSVIVVKDGVKHESQQWGDEHGPEVSTFDIERIEILRGPASLIYGADGIGGVVNIISKDLTLSDGRKPATYGTLDLNGFSVNKEGAGNLVLGMGFKNIGIKGSIGYRNSGNITTPSGELTVETPEGQRTITGGELSNSATRNLQGSLIFGYNTNFGNLTAVYENLSREIQIHEDPEEEPGATPNQKISTNHFELKGKFPVNKKLHLESIVSYESHVRKEFESTEDKNGDNPALNLKLKNVQGDLRLQHLLTKDIEGTFGIAINSSNNQSLGEEKLIPNYDAFGYGLYLTERYEQKYYTISGGARYDHKRENIKETIFETDENGNAVKVVSPRELTFDAVTGSLGIVIKPASYADIFSNIGRGWRAPSEFDLYADGVHEGTGRFDRGLLTVDSTLTPEPEESLNFDIGVRVRNKYVTGELSFFRNVINNFIYPAPTGETDPESNLPIYDITQDKSSFIGVEYSVQIQPTYWILLSLRGDYVNTNNEVAGNPLPFTPPAKNIVELKLQEKSIGRFNNPYFSFTSKFVSAQNNVDPLESPSIAHTLISAGMGFDYILAKSIISVDLSVTNLTDTKYTGHLSRYRYYAMNPGRSFNLKVSVPFQF